MKNIWESGVTALPVFTLALDGSERVASRPVNFTSKKRAHDTHWTGGWVGPKAVEKNILFPLPGIEPRSLVLQPVAYNRMIDE
jgi:hypothetical protein